MDFSTVSAINHVTIRDDAVHVDKEAATARKLLPTRIESFDGHR